MSIPAKKLALIEAVKLFHSENGRFPSLTEMIEHLGIPRRTLRRYFGNTTKFIKEVSKTIDEPLFTDQRADEVKSVVSKHKRFFITTAVVGAPAFKEAVKAVKNSWAKRTGGVMMIIPAADPAASVSDGLSPDLANENIVFQNTDLNSNIAIFSLKLSAKQINPTTGLGRLGQRNKSFIFASPKQSLEYVPVGNNKLPHALMSTGAITLPAYATSKYMSMRTAFIAENDHVMGGVIVEIENDKMYHFRHVTFNKDGSFTDLGDTYHPNGKVTHKNIELMTLGDWHSGSTCEMVKKVTHQMIKDLQPKHINLHDVFDGKSVSHHIESKSITKAVFNPPTIVEEGNLLKSDLQEFLKHPNIQRINIVKSNHDDWIDRYLEDGRYIKDHRNLRKALELAIAKHDGEDVLEALVGKHPKIKFLKRDEDLVYFGVHYECHGDDNHKSMSPDQLERAYGQSTSGHSHTPYIRRGVRKVGTSTKLREHYAKGPISWVNCHEIVNADGSRQLINIYNGKYRK